MEHIALRLDRRFRRFDPSASDWADFDVVTWGRRNRFLGVILKRQLILLDWKRLSTWRIRLSNLATVTSSAQVIRLDAEITAKYPLEELERYFEESEDNPFSVWNVLQALMGGEAPSDLTRFPPLTYAKEGQHTALQALREQARIGDSVFTFNRKSGLSSLIRRFDWCMWSHVAICGEGATLYEATTSEIAQTSFDRLNDPNLDVALYRPKVALDIDQQKLLPQLLDSKHGRNRFPWLRVIRIMLSKNFGLPYKRRPTELTPADMMYGNGFQLVGYA